MKQIFTFVFVIGVIDAILILAMMLDTAISADIKTVKRDRGSIHAPASHDSMSHGVTDGYSTIVIDLCEYIEASHKLAHKGNCRFCAERHRSGLKEIVELNNNDNYDKDSI